MANKETLIARRDQLQEQAELMTLEREVRAMESILGVDTFQQRVLEGMLRPGDPILSPRQIQREIGWGNGSFGAFSSQADDYYQGQCKPFYENEIDLQNIRGLGRFLAGSTEMAECVLRNVKSYTIDDGFTAKVTPKPGGEQLAADLQTFVDDFRTENRLKNFGESDAIERSVIDGDYLLWLRPNGPNPPRVRFVGSEHITEPDNPRAVEDYAADAIGCGLDWKFGVASDVDDPESVHGYFINWFGQDTNWDLALASESVFYKRNVPRPCKRGISDFYIPFYSIDRGSKLFDNMVKGATIQASIAYIKSAATGTSAETLQNQLQNRLTGSVNVMRPDGTTGTAVGETILGGKIINSSGSTFHYGPMGTPQGPVFVEVYQLVARRVATRWCMKESMISGDASNNNLASELVAGDPFVKAIRKEQNDQKDKEEELIWKAVDMAAKYGRFGGLTSRELKKLVKLELEAISPEVRDPAKDEEVFDKQQAAGVLSARTRAAKSNLDYEQEIANGAKEKVEPTPFGAPGQIGPHTLPTGYESEDFSLAFRAMNRLMEGEPV